MTDKDEEIVLHNDVIRATTLYDDVDPIKIKQNVVPKLNEMKKEETIKVQNEDFWATSPDKKNHAQEIGIKMELEEDDINVI